MFFSFCIWATYRGYIYEKSRSTCEALVPERQLRASSFKSISVTYENEKRLWFNMNIGMKKFEEKRLFEMKYGRKMKSIAFASVEDASTTLKEGIKSGMQTSSER